MMPVFRPSIVHRREEKNSTPPKEKTYSYHEVEDILCRGITSLDFTEIMRQNNINIECVPDCKERCVIVTIRQGDKVVKFALAMKGE